MTAIVSKNPLVRKIADGQGKDELLEMLVNKQLALTEEEYLECFVLILRNPAFQAKAMAGVKKIADSVKSTYIEKPNANHRVGYFILIEVLNRKIHTIISKAIRNQAYPFEFLQKIAEKGDATSLEALLDNQVKLIAYPEILDTIESNPAASNFIKGKIKEIRDFYLDDSLAEEIDAEDVMEEVKEMVSLDDKEEKGEPESEDGDDGDDDEDDELLEEAVEEKAMNALQLINSLTISQRIKLALTGTRTQRMILIKDTNKMVSMAVLESPKISPDEILLLCKNKSIARDLIGKISQNREWTKNYNIIMALVYNPKTPVKAALSFIKKLHMKDLMLLARDKNVNPVVRNLALKLQETKQKK